MDRHTWLSNVEFRGSAGVPCRVWLGPGVQAERKPRLRELAARHGGIEVDGPGAEDDTDASAPSLAQGETFRDAWGCLWEAGQFGEPARVLRPALQSWDNLESFQPPSPAENGHFHPIDWDEERRLIQSGRAAGALIHGALDHGFTFQRLAYLRGFENLMADIGHSDERLDELCAGVLRFNEELVRRYLDIGVDVMNFGDDLGTQRALTISPRAWRRYVKPAYARLFGMCRRADAHVAFHSDGCIVEVLPDLIECGVTLLNLQDLCNGIGNIRRLVKSHTCIDLDIDRQRILAAGTPTLIDQHVERCVEELAMPEGGLMITCVLDGMQPWENVTALFRALSAHRGRLA